MLIAKPRDESWRIRGGFWLASHLCSISELQRAICCSACSSFRARCEIRDLGS